MQADGSKSNRGAIDDGGANAPTRLRIGTYLGANEAMLGFQQEVAARIADRLDVSYDFVVETSYDSFNQGLNDVCFVCGLAYVTFERQGYDLAVPVAAPILAGPRYGGRPIYFSDIIVRRDSGILGFSDLRNKAWAYNEPLSQSGYGITRYHLARLGETNGFFGEVVEAGSHRNSIRMVASGRVDGAAIDCQVLAIELRDDPELARLVTVVDVLGPSSIQPVAVSPRLRPSVCEEIRQALLALGDGPECRKLLDSVMVDRFVSVDGTGYDDIRAMLSFCESLGYLELA